MVHAVQSIKCTDLPFIKVIYRSCCFQMAANIKDSHHPGHILISRLPSGRNYRNLKNVTTKFKNSLFPATSCNWWDSQQLSNCELLSTVSLVALWTLVLVLLLLSDIMVLNLLCFLFAYYILSAGIAPRLLQIRIQSLWSAHMTIKHCWLDSWI